MTTKPTVEDQASYHQLLGDVRQTIQSARHKVSRTVQSSLIGLYWEIGGLILERQERFGWGKSVVERLARDLKAFDGGLGVSPQNLWFMRQFRLEYRDEPILQQLVRELPWGQNLVIFTKVKERDAREFYLREAAKGSWSRSDLIQQIKADAWSRRGMEVANNFHRLLPERQAELAAASLRESYDLGFLGLDTPVREREIEAAMVARIRGVLLEFGHGFAFMGNQYRVAVGRKEIFLDLLFYHRFLRCLVAVELKAGAFEPEHAGKMNYYLNILDAHVKAPDENPSIGIILCADRDGFEVEYALRGIEKPMGVSEFQLTSKLPRDLKKHLPGPDRFLEAIDSAKRTKEAK
ncbi:MAG TPA: PDDEXK nuclease domain-containing protein [Fibrobacteria bacterium]|nr:PDDEXK nuclease domain-containing protein [Fibrobacteria bacterium]